MFVAKSSKRDLALVEAKFRLILKRSHLERGGVVVVKPMLNQNFCFKGFGSVRNREDSFQKKMREETKNDIPR